VKKAEEATRIEQEEAKRKALSLDAVKLLVAIWLGNLDLSRQCLWG
jgi:hypothetical protein